MGNLVHTTIVVTSDSEYISLIRDKAVDIFYSNLQSLPESERAVSLISEIVSGIIKDGIASFFIAPDGSGKGYELHQLCGKARKEFLQWLSENSMHYYISYTCVAMDDNAGYNELIV